MQKITIIFIIILFIVFVKSFISTSMIDDTPTENAGTGLHSFRDRNKSKEIQHSAFTTYQPNKVETFGQIKPMKHIPHEKFEKMKRKYDRMREKRAASVLNTYSDKLQKVMETLP